jgi:glycosyltransferase 2 family protein
VNRSPTRPVGPSSNQRSEPAISEPRWLRRSRSDRLETSRPRAETWPGRWRMPHPGWAWVRLAAGILVLGILVLRFGADPFLDGVRLTSAWSLLVATAITAATTLCCAWRWQLVASGLDVRIGLRTAVRAVYRAQFLNAALPGGVLGDVDRAVGHGRDTGALGRSVRSVLWERTLGQAVQLAITVAILVALPSPMRTIGLVAVAILVVGLPLARLILLAPPGGVATRATSAVAADLRAVLRTARLRRGVALASLAAVAGHLLVFVIAAHVAGVTAPAYRVLPLAAVVLLAAAIPANVAGWGPREGVAAWAFAAAGLGAAAGVTTAVVYGVMALVATLPGAVVLMAGRRPRAAGPVRSPLRAPEEALRA